MHKPQFLPLTLALVAALLSACGGGGGSSDVAPATTPAPVRMSALAPVAVWPESFKTVSVSQTDLVTAGERAATPNSPNSIFIQVWYLNQDQQRQTLGVLSLQALTQMGGTLTFSQVPVGITALHSEVYTRTGNDQLTLAIKDIRV